MLDQDPGLDQEVKQLDEDGDVNHLKPKSFMRRKKKELVVAPKCDYCGERSETFVCTADHLTFCRIQYVGHPPIKDCMTDYYEEKKNVQKKRKRKQLMDTTKSRLSKQRKRKRKSIN